MPVSNAPTLTPPVPVPATLLFARLTISPDAFAAYEAQAAQAGLSLDSVLSRRLEESAYHTASKPLYFSDKDRQQLEQILGRNILHTADAILQVRNAMSVRLQRVIITLSVGLLAKLKTRCLGMEWEAFITQTVTQQLERYVGMR